jgi:hypothetical protein
VFPSAAEDERVVDDLRALDRELRHDAVFVFDLDRQFVMRQHIARMIEDCGQFTGVESMIEIVMHPGLQQASLQGAPSATAVDEALQNVPYLRDVKVGGDQAAVWQQKAQGLVCMGTEL